MLLETRTFREIWTNIFGCQRDSEGELVKTSVEGCGPGGTRVAGGPHGWYCPGGVGVGGCHIQSREDETSRSEQHLCVLPHNFWESQHCFVSFSQSQMNFSSEQL